MATPNTSSGSPDRSSTPNPLTNNSRFTPQSSTAEDLLKSQTVGLVHLSDFRKRRAEALEQKEREAQDRSLGRSGSRSGSGAATPLRNGALSQSQKQKKRKVARGKLSFGVNDDEGQTTGDDSPIETISSEVDTSRTTTPEEGNLRKKEKKKGSPLPEQKDKTEIKRLGPNASVSYAPKVMTKSALLREAQTREHLRKEFLAIQEAVRTTEILMPFVFYDGTNIPGGVCKVKKGDHVWLFLDKARKVGAERGVGGAGERAHSRREWARVGVDDLLLVRGEIIIPHHYDFYYFLVNKTIGTTGTPLFDYSNQPTAMTPSSPSPPAAEGLQYITPKSAASKKSERTPTPLDDRLEGFDHDPTITKVVDRRWYERNKHIFPASVWQDFEPDRDYSNAIRRDTGGNAFFFA
ncbi:MAG: hypothetical protein M1837_003176 [Sclerophora amabilis]|nr:MAG: hypothetical protein M1837_003176 [Sclerophora amabilis]